MRTTTILLLSSLALASCEGRMGGTMDGGRDLAKAGQKYVIQSDDSLFGIAREAYGNGMLWPKILEANPWIDPDRLVVNDLISIPEIYREEYDPAGPYSPIERVGQRDDGEQYARRPATPPHHQPNDLGDAPVQGDGTSTHSNPGNGNPGSGDGKRSVWNTLRSRVGSKTFFGMTLDKLSFYVILAAMFHALFQGFVVWITTNITFVKDASLKKSLQATFLTEMLSLCTLALIGAVALIMAYAGTNGGGEAASAVAGSSPMLFPSVEEFARTRNGAAAVGFVLLALYVILSLRFIPQVFGIERSQAFTVVFLGVLLPHFIAIYMVGQRLGYL